ncbi:MAG: aldo/keto reductase [Promethearchaeota archaeon]|nr:MAG: aldo/keto reductase [Candidatus Lokiarchaeota archaeon]
MNLSINSTYKLNNGVKIPVLGFGTWGLEGKTAINATRWAIEIGYRLIDTAFIYGNEVEVGKAIKASEVLREEIFITTKVWQTDMRYKKTFKSFERSLKNLDIDYLDLFLIHWPREKRLETWRAMEKIYEEGKVKSIGVSNFTISNLKELLSHSEIIPVVNQVEFSPFLYQKDLLEFCHQHKIQLEAYSPLTRANKLNNPVLKDISNKYKKTTAQILLRWALQHQIIAIPKSSSKEHIEENANIFDFIIEEADMKKLDRVDECFRVVEDPIFD